MSNKEIDLLILDNMYFKKRILENRLRLNLIYYKKGIFDLKDYNKFNSKLNRGIDLINSDMNYKRYLINKSSEVLI